MKKTYGVCAGMLAMGLAIFCAPASHAKRRLAGGEAGNGSETNAAGETSAPSTPAASSPADLRERIEALKAELAKLNNELAAEKDPGATAPTAVPSEEQGSTTTTTTQAPTTTTTATATTPPMPLPTPAMTAPLATAIPHEIPAGPFGKIDVTGVLSGMGLTQGNYQGFLGDTPTNWDLSNAQVFVQKTTGWWQFYLQGGAYNIPAIGVPFTPTKATITNLYGPFPVGYLKFVKGNFNAEVGSLPTLIGAEYTFSFENMNIERGLLWGQEPAISRGIQLSDTYKKLSVSFSWNDGFYSNRYSSLSGSLAWAFNSSNTLTFAASGNAGSYARISNPNPFAPVTPLLQNNSEVYNLIYAYSHGNWMITPYYQYTLVKKNTSLLPFNIPAGAHTNGGAILANYNFKHGVSLAGRFEYIKSSGGNASNAANLLGYGPGTGAYSFTVTPTYVKDAFFIRGDFSYVDVTNFNATTGTAFSPTGLKTNQPRGVIEAGFLF
jgi:putative OmpL-like beta-barrel porin-2